ncbi:MAG TPA: hypothetical protein VF582_09365 [Allosphingosinicella sp.]
MKPIGWVLLLIVTLAWSFCGPFMAFMMIGIGGPAALWEPLFWLYALPPLPLVAFTVWSGVHLYRAT